MEAIQSSTQAMSNVVAESQVSLTKSIFTMNEEALEFNRYGIMSVGILLIGIVGGLTVGLSALDYLWQISVIAIFTMVSFSAMLALVPMKWVVRTTVLALAIDLGITLLNFAF